MLVRRNELWPSQYTAAHTATIFLNGTLQLVNASIPITQLLNAPVRVWHSIRASQKKNYIQIAFTLAAFAVLLLPQGRWMAIGIDLTAEGLNWYCSTPKPKIILEPATPIQPQRLDPTIPKDAQAILLLSAEQANFGAPITQQRDQMIALLKTQQARFSPWLTSLIEAKIEEIKTAANTLIALGTVKQ